MYLPRSMYVVVLCLVRSYRLSQDCLLGLDFVLIPMG